MSQPIKILLVAAIVCVAACGGYERPAGPSLCDRIAVLQVRKNATDEQKEALKAAIGKLDFEPRYAQEPDGTVVFHILGKRDKEGKLVPVKPEVVASFNRLPGVERALPAGAPADCRLTCDKAPSPEIDRLREELDPENKDVRLDPKERQEKVRKLAELEAEARDTVSRCPTGFLCSNNQCVQDYNPRQVCNEQGDVASSDGQCHTQGTAAKVVYWILDFPATKWVFLILALVMPLASILTWMERRQSAMMQDRLGPNRANIGPIKLKGILHFVADAVKMIFKEDFIPANVHRGLFALAPILAIAPVFIAFCIIPFGPTVYPHSFWQPLDTGALAADPDAWAFSDAIRMQMFQIDFGLIFYFAILTLANYGGTIAGWASYNKWALLGGLRSSSQMMSYEVAMGLSLMGAFLVAGTLEPGEMVLAGATSSMSGSNPLNWLWLWQPVGLVLFCTAAIAETKRAPFDIPEGEPEIIGYFVEYSGLRWGLFFLAEFVEIVFISAVMVSVFFGGWQVPFLDADGFRIGGYVDEMTRVSTGGYVFPLPHGLVIGLQFAAFGAKVVLLCWFQLMIRWTLPRFRADQLMNLGWKLLLPLTLANIMVTALIKLLFMGT
ncbi:MAG: NADH-quinone oxidoreductase subunit H [Deltaproteobacteria bacterium]|nr:NADH-quinone oxidoreductase subunit H [Deltaproteobacteria bacterium]